MKTLKILLTTVLTFAIVAVHAEDFKKKIHKEFTSGKNTILEVLNKFGDVNITDWDKNVISIDVTITIDTKNEEKAKKYFDDINIRFSENSKLVKAETDINGSFNNISFSIDYEIKMPKSTNLNLSNRYGAVYINELSGIVDISVKYGSLNINKLWSGKTTPKSAVEIGYSKGNIKECNWLKVGCAYSKLDIDKSKVLMIESKYSKLDIGSASTIVTESKYDTPYDIGEVNNFVCKGKYSKYNIDKLNNKLDLIIGYSNVDIDEISPRFEIIEIDTKYGNVELGIPSDVSYQLKANVDYGSVRYPDSEYLSRQKDGSNLTLSGIVGNNKNTKAKVSILGRYGNIDLED